MAGIIVLPACIVSALMNPFSGRIYDTIGPKIPVTIGFILILADLLIEMLFMVHVSAYVMMGICFIYCIGQSFALGNVTTFALRNLPGDQWMDRRAQRHRHGCGFDAHHLRPGSHARRHWPGHGQRHPVGAVCKLRPRRHHLHLCNEGTAQRQKAIRFFSSLLCGEGSFFSPEIFQPARRNFLRSFIFCTNFLRKNLISRRHRGGEVS